MTDREYLKSELDEALRGLMIAADALSETGMSAAGVALIALVAAARTAVNRQRRALDDSSDAIREREARRP